MGFYIRKSFTLGPLRLNLSRSGLGASIGVKGLRVGSGPRGSYVQMGRGGFYYRQALNDRPTRQVDDYPSASSLQEPESSPANRLFDSSATELLQQLNRVKGRFDLLP